MEKIFLGYEKALETLHTGRATIVVTKAVKDPLKKSCVKKEEVLYSEIPCRLSYRLDKNLTQDEGMFSSANKTISLFTSPSIDIPEGSKILVNWQGRKLELKNSSLPAIHKSHNEYIVEMVKDVI